MKPLKLAVKGLHSFREKQTIDFAALCEGGVFGIFGPTGSGKSSILDAMTLALYGKVERAPNNTQGILNHGEDELYVSFTFQLGHGKQRKTYEVERTFKRAGEVQIRSATCRLIEIGKERVVLADKTNDVNRKVENLLGLSIDDFMRAVVLPQGKFSEFLSLKGAERRQMLQRLFHLEKYGDQLNAKIKSHLMNTKLEKELIEKEQQALGNASEEAIEETKIQISLITKQLNEIKQEELRLEKQLEEEKEIFSLLEEKRRTEEKIAALHEKEAEIEENNRLLTRAKDAKVLIPFVADIENSLKEIENSKQKVLQGTERLNEMYHLLKIADEQFHKAKEKKEQNEHLLRTKLEKLQQLKKEQQELTKEKEHLHSLTKEIKSIEKKIEELEKEKEKSAHDLELYEKKRMELQDKLKQLTVPIEEKRAIYKAIDEKRKIETFLPQLEQLNEEIKVEKEKEAKLSREMISIEENLQEKEERLRERFEQIYQWYDRICQEEREIHAYRYTLLQYKEALEEQHKHILIAQLRKELQENEPCPVCGSLEHPIGITEEHQEDVIDGEQITIVKQLLNEMEQMTRSFDRMKYRLEDEANKLHEFIQPKEPLPLSTNEDDFRLLKLDEKEVSNIETVAEEWKKIMNKIKKEQEAIEHLFQRMSEEIKVFINDKEQWKDVINNKERVNQRISQLTEKYNQLNENYEGKKKTWSEYYPNFDYQSINEQYHVVQLKDEEAAHIRERIENSTPHIQGKQKDIERVTNEIHEWKVKESARKSEFMQRKKVFAEKEERLKKALGDWQIDDLIATTNNELTTLLDEYNIAEIDRHEKQEQVNELEKQLTLYKEALRQGEEWFKRAYKQWEEEAKKTTLRTMEAVKAAILDEAQIINLERIIEEYNNEKRAAHVRLKDTLDKLAGRNITEEQMNKTRLNLMETKEKREWLGEEKGKLEGILADLTEKVKRFNELEKKRKELEEKYSQYEKLDQVFRGKAFVEFIAEEQLIQVSRLASERLHTLTHGRYALEVDSNGGFVIRDDANGGVKRPVSTLSGGETFLTSLALALSLSTSIQLKGEHPLEFFFLDEGFGTLDQELLETVINALEKLHTDKLAVGVISHVPELKERLPRKINVIPAEPGGRGSRVVMETL